MAAAERKPRPFDVVLVDAQFPDRRDLPDALRFLELMKFVGVQAIFISQNIDSTHEQADTMVAIHGHRGLALSEGTEQEDEARLGRSARAWFRHRRVHLRVHVGPAATLSGKGDANREPKPVSRYRAIVPDEAAVIVGIYEAYARQGECRSHVDELNQADVPGPRNEPCGYNAVRRILRNERYRGLLIWANEPPSGPGKRWKVSRSGGSQGLAHKRAVRAADRVRRPLAPGPVADRGHRRPSQEASRQ